MKIIATADLHGNLPEVPECDLLIIGGDICPDMHAGRTSPHGQSDWLAGDFSDWLEAIPAPTVVGIAGNHDFVFEKKFLLPKFPEKFIYLEDDETSVEGLRIYGTPWCPNLINWAFYGNDKFLQRRADVIPRGVDILITHSPPYGVADECGPKYGAAGQHVGDRYMNEAIERVEPKVTICGHIHESFGVYEIPGTILYSVAYVDENYDPKDRLVEISLD